LTSTIDQFIQDAVREKQPDTVEQLAQLVQQKFMISKEEAMKHIMGLNINGKLDFKVPLLPVTRRAHLFSLKAMWYWLIIVLNVAAVASVFIIPENAFPIAYVRYLLGSFFVFFLPGFCLIKALFPRKELEQIERTILSVGISLAIVPLISYLLNFTYWGITTATLTPSLVALTVVFATVAVLREHRVRVE